MSRSEETPVLRPDAGTQPAWRRSALRRRLISVLLVGALVVAMALDTTYRDPDDDTASADDEAYDAAAFAEENYDSEVVPAVQDNAVELPDLLDALAEDEQAAGEDHGHRDGSSGPYNFAVRGTGQAGDVDSGQLPVEVDDIPDDVDVAVQTGPAISGTALRDATGLVTFDQFTNQLEYREAATALNEQVQHDVLADLDAESLGGEEIAFTGAFTYANPSFVLITPVELEVVP